MVNHVIDKITAVHLGRTKFHLPCLIFGSKAQLTDRYVLDCSQLVREDIKPTVVDEELTRMKNLG